MGIFFPRSGECRPAPLDRLKQLSVAIYKCP